MILKQKAYKGIEDRRKSYWEDEDEEKRKTKMLTEH